MSKLFESTSIKNMVLENRFVRSATWEGMADVDGSCTVSLTELMVELARGGVGMIISSHAYVRREGQAGPLQLGIYGDELLSGLSDMTDAVHKANGRIVLQLAHAGCQAAYSLTGLEAVGPSAVGSIPSREMTTDEIRQTVEAFGSGATLAKRAGFDGVQIHAAHGYLLSQFLSPFYNKRQDNYGGSLQNRARMVLQVLQSVRAAVGDSFPVLIKMNSEDFVDGGLSVDEMVQVALMLEKDGIDAIELSGGTMSSGKYGPVRRAKRQSEENDVYYLGAARRYKETVKVPLLLVGGIRSYEVAEKLVDEGSADYIALSRPLIREPRLINQWKSGDRRQSRCLSDNRCFRPTMEGNGLRCVAEEKLVHRDS